MTNSCQLVTFVPIQIMHSGCTEPITLTLALFLDRDLVCLHPPFQKQKQVHAK
uniref:Uncharacterized protein n=1 Tax=Arundo donax TaxID=35708 RepID=A0A0A9E6K6_ARUDO